MATKDPQTATVLGWQLNAVTLALDDLADNPLLLRHKADLNRIRIEVGRLRGVWADEIRPLVQKYTGGSTEITEEHKRYDEFIADPEVQETMNQEAELEFRPIPFAELEAEEERLRSKSPPQSLDVDADNLQVLTELGIVEREGE